MRINHRKPHCFYQFDVSFQGYHAHNRHKFDADVDLIKIKASHKKSVLEQNIAHARQKVKKARGTLTTVSDRLMELKIQKELNVLEKDLKRKKEALYLDQMRIEATAEEQIEQLCTTDNIEIILLKVFKVKIS